MDTAILGGLAAGCVFAFAWNQVSAITRRLDRIADSLEKLASCVGKRGFGAITTTQYPEEE